VADRGRSGGWFGGPASPDAPVEESSRVAKRLSAPDPAGISRAGLPIRTPRAHLVPGAFGADGEGTSSTRDTPPPPDRSAEEVRKHLDEHRSGVRRARRSTA
jgi:hypothetical protein